MTDALNEETSIITYVRLDSSTVVSDQVCRDFSAAMMFPCIDAEER